MSGFAFFHEQDSSRAAAGGPLLISYGTLGDREPDAAVAVGHRVVAALRGQGLRTTWSGARDERIAVDLAWQRRLPS